jgi:hypothetical protein
MEPEAIDFFGRMVEDKTDMEQQQGSASTMAMLSIAVSMKRIADAVTHAPDGPAYNLYDFIKRLTETVEGRHQ